MCVCVCVDTVAKGEAITGLLGRCSSDELSRRVANSLLKTIWKQPKRNLGKKGEILPPLLTVLGPGLLREHVVGQHSFVRLGILLFLERDQRL